MFFYFNRHRNNNDLYTMRRIYIGIYAMLIILVFFACKKDKATSAIIGNWELRVAYDGWGGQITYPGGNGTILKFTSGTYQTYLAGQLVKSGHYALVKDTMYIIGAVRDRIIYDNKFNAIRTFVEVSNNRLILNIDAYDAPAVSYERQ